MRLRGLLKLLPILFFSTICFCIYLTLNLENQNELPSALLGKNAPSLELRKLAEYETPSTLDMKLKGKKLVNFWASWCPPCKAEHPILEEIANDKKYPIFGVNYKDSPENAQTFLSSLGNPYTKLGADPKGRTAINWGVYGVPETFIIDESGLILMRHPGPITQKIYLEKIKPLLESQN